MICENCGKEHNGTYKTGRFCCEKCAKSFSTKNDKRILIETKCIDCGKIILVGKRSNLNKCRCEECRKRLKSKRKEKYYVCGNKENDLKYQEISKHHIYKWFYNLIPFGFDINNIGTENIINDFYKVKNLLYEEYIINKLSPKDIYEKYKCNKYINHSETLLHIFKEFGFITRNSSESVKNAYLNGKLQNISVNQYHSEWHKTWDGNEVYLRSSFESDYSNELDEQKIKYEVENLRIKYFNTKLNEYHCAIPDFYLPETNTIVEIKSSYTLDIQEMKDKVKAYKELGYNFKLILEHKETDLYSL